MLLNEEAGVLYGFDRLCLFRSEVDIETALQFGDQQQEIYGIEVEVILQMSVGMNVLNRHVEPPTDEVDDALLHIIKC